MIEQAALKFSQGAPPRSRGHDPAKHTTDGGQRATASKYSEKKAAATAAESAARLAKIPKFIVPKSVVEAMRKPIEQHSAPLDSAPKATSELRPKVKPLIVRNVKKKKSAVSKGDKVQPPASNRRMGAGRPPLSKRQASDRYLEGNELGGIKRSRRMVIAVRSSDDEDEEEEEEVVSRVSPTPKRRPVVVNETLAGGKAAVTAKVTGLMRGGVSRKDGIVAATPPALSQSDSVIANRKAFGDLFSKVCPASGAVNLG